MDNLLISKIICILGAPTFFAPAINSAGLNYSNISLTHLKSERELLAPFTFYLFTFYLLPLISITTAINVLIIFDLLSASNIFFLYLLI